MQIVNLNLFSAEITALQKFYTNDLDFELNDINRSYFSVKIGNSILKFTKRQFDLVSNYILVIKVSKEKFQFLSNNEKIVFVNEKIEALNSNYLIVKDQQSNLIIFIESEFDKIQSVFFVADKIDNIVSKLISSNLESYIGDTNTIEHKYFIIHNSVNSLITKHGIEISPFSINFTIEGSPKSIIFNGKDVVVTNF